MVNIISFNHSSSYIVRFAPSLHLDFCNLPVVQFYLFYLNLNTAVCVLQYKKVLQAEAGRKAGGQKSGREKNAFSLSYFFPPAFRLSAFLLDFLLSLSRTNFCIQIKTKYVKLNSVKKPNRQTWSKSNTLSVVWTSCVNKSEALNQD